MRQVWRVLAPAIGLLALIAPRGWPCPAALQQNDIQFIVSEAQKVQMADVAAWSRYQFGRRAEREDYDDSGQVTGTDDLEFVVTPDGDGFREDLVRHNGAAALSSDRDAQRRSGAFNKHYKTLAAGAEGQEESGYSIGQLLHLSSYHFMGRERLNGVDCYRLDFHPDDVQPRSGGLVAKFTKAMQGSLWITVEGFHLAAAQARTMQPISIALSLSKVYELKIRMEAGPVGEGVWLPLRVEVSTNARIVIKMIRRRNLFTYSDFLRVTPAG
jgi:hypothetical protein